MLPRFRMNYSGRERFWSIRAKTTTVLDEGQDGEGGDGQSQASDAISASPRVRRVNTLEANTSCDLRLLCRLLVHRVHRVVSREACAGSQESNEKHREQISHYRTATTFSEFAHNPRG